MDVKCGELFVISKILTTLNMHLHVHIKLIKEILGVHSIATNVACLAELYRYPLKNKILLLSFKFLEHISNLNNTHLSKQDLL